MAPARPSTAFSTTSNATSRFTTTTSYPSYQNAHTDASSQHIHGRRSSTTRPGTSRPGTARLSTRSRSRAGSVIGGGESQKIICALSESRGVTPTVGLAFVNITTGEAVLSQICDNQFYARSLNKLLVFDPSEILIVSTSGPANPTKMYQIIEENIIGAKMITVDRRYWSETAGLDYIRQLAFIEDVEAVKVAIGGNFYATCCLSAVGTIL